MKIHITPAAVQALRDKKPEPDAALRLAATHDGCGCGATVLYELNWDIPRPEDQRWHVDRFTLVMDPDSRPFFDPEITIDYHPERDTFALKSSNQIYLHHIYL